MVHALLPRFPLPRSFPAARFGILVVVAGIVLPAPAAAQYDAEVERRLLADLLRDGKYQQVISETRRVEKVVKPSKKAPIGPGSRAFLDLLTFRGMVERRMGNLDAADKTLAAAYKLASDSTFQQTITLNAPKAAGNAQSAQMEKESHAYYLAVENSYLELFDNRTEAMLERIRDANQRRAAQAAARRTTAATPAKNQTRGADSAEQSNDEAVDDRNQIVSWFKRVDEMIEMSQTARGSLRGQFVEPGSASNSAAEAVFADSPQARVTASLSRPNRLMGMRYLEASKLPWTLSFDMEASEGEDATDRRVKTTSDETSADEPEDESPEDRAAQAASQRRRALAYLQRSAELAEGAMGPVLALVAEDEEAIKNNGLGKLSTAFREAANKEVARVRADRLVPMAEAQLLDEDLDAARATVDVALAESRKAEVPKHPEFARPLMVSAEISFAQARRSLASGDAEAANTQARDAVQALTEAKSLITAKDSAFDPAAPLHDWLASQLAVSESFAASSSQTAAQKTAADAAARRALQAMKSRQKPQPAPNPAAPTQ